MSASGLRKFHRYAAVIAAAPLLVMIVTGITLQLKNQIGWIQPPAERLEAQAPKLSFDHLLQVTQTVPEAEVGSWEDIRVVDVRPGQGVIRVRTRNEHEIQVDAVTGAVLAHGPRRTGLLIALHEGSWFGSVVRYGVFLPGAILLLILWTTGIFLYIQPSVIRRLRKVATA
jgi:uncharacterized iron-regulated membrane protein